MKSSFAVAALFCVMAVGFAHAQSCPAVDSVIVGGYIDGYNYRGDEAKYAISKFMSAARAEDLDEALVFKNYCDPHKYVSSYKSRKRDGYNHFFSAPNRICFAVLAILKCHQAMGWPLSQNPRAIVHTKAVDVPQERVVPIKPSIETIEFETAVKNGPADLFSLSEKRGCLTLSPPDPEVCKKIDIATADSIWIKYECASKPRSAVCQSTVKFNKEIEKKTPSTFESETRKYSAVVDRSPSSPASKCSKEVGVDAKCQIVPRTGNLGSLDGNSLRCVSTRSFMTYGYICKVSKQSDCEKFSVSPHLSEKIIQTFPGDEYKRFIQQQPQCVD